MHCFIFFLLKKKKTLLDLCLLPAFQEMLQFHITDPNKCYWNISALPDVKTRW